MTEFSLYPSSPAVLDGGFATTLEDDFHLNISNTPLWSAQQIIDNPAAVVDVHLAFLRAGAQIIMTSTYQCSMDAFQLAGLSQDTGRNTMLQSVHLAQKARIKFKEENPNAGEIKIALSLGPFGTSLQPGHEHDGIYPPPYGPKAYSDMDENTNTFGEDTGGESDSIDALATFHLERLLVFGRDHKAWSMIDIIAFESVPLTREVKAIREAMGRFRDALVAEDMDSGRLKPWWISCNFPKGHCPEMEHPSGRYLGAREQVMATLGGGLALAPTGIGINCTPPDKIPSLIEEMCLTLQEQVGVGDRRPWLVLYPNSGKVYDHIERVWKGLVDEEEGKWERDLLAIFRDVVQRWPGAWGGFVLGGCCVIGPGSIRRLRGAL